jgi:hypothetical protein
MGRRVTVCVENEVVEETGRHKNYGIMQIKGTGRETVKLRRQTDVRK